MARQASLFKKLRLRRKSLLKRKWSRVDLLTDQDRWWVSASGRLVDVPHLAERDHEYAVALLHYWRLNAHRMRLLALFRFRGPYEEFTDDFDSTDEEWVSRQPLYCALEDALILYEKE